MSVVESAGLTSLDQDIGNHYVLGGSVTVLYLGLPAFAGQFGAWMPIGVEQVAGIYKLVWKNGIANEYTIWDVDNAGNFLSQFGSLTNTSPMLRSLEPGFNQDLSSSGGIEPGTIIDSAGSTRLTNVAGAYVLSPAGSALGPQLKYGIFPVVTGQFGTWTPLGAEQIGGIYKIVWKNGIADQFVVWDVDSSGNWLSQSMSMAGTNVLIRSLEAVFGQDFNGGGIETGTIIESVGTTTLISVAGAYVLSPSGNASAAYVPLETSGGEGTAGAHWSEGLFGNELMTGFVSGSTNPLSILTIAALRDLGYTVDTTKADAYTLS